MNIDLEHYNITTVYKAENLWEEVLYDYGPEETFENIKYNFDCRNCKQPQKTIKFREFIDNPIYHWDKEKPKSLEILIKKANLNSKSYDDLKVVNTINGFTPYLCFKECLNCHQNYIVVFGFGEKQPTRYIAHLQAILHLDKKILS